MNAIPAQFTKEWQDERAKYAQDHADVLNASITEAYADITDCQRMDYMIAESTVKNRKTEIRRWSKVLDAAGITNVVDLDDNMRRHELLKAVSAAIDNRELGSTAGAMARSMEHFGQMLRTINYNKAGMITKAVNNVLKEKKLIDNGQEPYTVDELAQLFSAVISWCDDNKLAPTLNDRKSAGQRVRAPAYPTIYRLAASLAIACNTGGRIGALLEMEVGDVDLATGQIRWAEYKKQTVRTYSKGKLDDWQIEMVRPWVEWRESKYPEAEYFFVSPRTGRPAADQIAYTMPLKRALESCGIIAEGERGGFHRFRHTIACEAIKEGASYADVARALNNTETMVAKVYGRYMNSHVGTGVRSILSDKVGKAMGAVKETINPTLQPCVEALEEIKNKIWRDAEEELGMKLHEPSVEVGIPDFVKMRVKAEIMRRQHYSVNPMVVGSSPINGVTNAQTIADAAKQAIQELESGSVEMAHAILSNLATWGGE